MTIKLVTADGKEIFQIKYKQGVPPVVETVGTITGQAKQPIQFQVQGVIIMEILGLPVTLKGDPPTKVQFILEIEEGKLPEGAFNLRITFNVSDADNTSEAELFVNNNFIEPNLWPGGNSRAHDQVTLQKIVIPGDILTEGSNIIEIELIKAGTGFIISDAPLIEVLGISDTDVRAILAGISQDFNTLSLQF